MAEKSLIMLNRENLELSKENAALKETVTKLLVELDRVKTLPVVAGVATSKIPVSTEQIIIEEQIQIYRDKSIGGALSLDDIRGLDLLIKNKKALDINKPVEPDWRDVSPDTPQDELLKLAGNVEGRRRNKSKTSSKNSVE